MGRMCVRDQVEPAQLLGDGTSSEVHQPSNWVAGLQRHTLTLVLCLLSIQAGLLAYSAKVHSPTWDEVGHLAAGLSHWELGRFELFSVNPPLVRTVASAPVYFFMQPQMDWDYYRSDPSLRSEVLLGRRMVELNGRESYNHFFVARLAVIPIALLGGLICFSWARDLFGPVSGVIALALWTFSPNVIAYGSVITPDMASMVALVGCCYVFWRWMKEPSWPWALSLGAALSLAVLSKSVWLALPLILFAIWVIVIALARPIKAGSGTQLREKSSFARTSIRLQFCQLAVSGGLTLLVLNLFYGFIGTLRPLEDFRFVSESFAGTSNTNELPTVETLDFPGGDDETATQFAALPIASGELLEAIGPVAPGNRYAGTWLGSLPVPLPENFLQGIDIQARDFDRGRYDAGWQSYLLGEWKQGGWRYFYVVGLAVKVPLAIWLLVLVSTITSLIWRPESEARLGIAILLIPAICFFVLVSSATGLNRYVRYALPVLPVLIVWASSIGRLLTSTPSVRHAALSRLRLPLAGLTAAACLWLTFASIYHTPNHLSYFNELAGGPENGHQVLCDSNIDWGQDLIALENWLDQNPEAKADLHLAYFGSIDPSALGIRYQLSRPLLVRGVGSSHSDATTLKPARGWHVISKNFLVGHSMPVPDGAGRIQFRFIDQPEYTYLAQVVPDDRIGHSMLAFKDPELAFRKPNDSQLTAFRRVRSGSIVSNVRTSIPSDRIKPVHSTSEAMK